MKSVSLLLVGVLVACGADDPSPDASTDGNVRDQGPADDASSDVAEDASSDAGSARDGGQEDAMLPPECPDTGVRHVTAELGWEAGDEVRDRFNDLLGTVDSGDTIVLSARYRLNPGGVTIPDGVRLTAVSGGGFELLAIEERPGGPWIRVGSCTHWDNISIVDGAPRASEEFVRTNNQIAVSASGENIVFRNSLFEVNTKTQLEFREVRSVHIDSTHFDNGYFTLLIRPPSSDIEISNSLFSNSFGDGIKTLGGGANDVRRVRVRNTVFEDGLRDGIDTTAGFRDSTVESCIFRGNGVSGMDIKNSYHSEEDLHPEGSPNTSIRVVDSEFIDSPNGIVLTTNDRAQLLTEQSLAIHLVHDIHLENAIVESNGGNTHVFLIKDAYDVSWDGVQLLGDVDLHRIFAPDENRTLAGNPVRPPIPMSNYDIAGEGVTMGSARGANRDYPFDVVGPR